MPNAGVLNLWYGKPKNEVEGTTKLNFRIKGTVFEKG